MAPGATTLREYVGKVLGLLGDGLYGFVDEVMAEAYGEDWAEKGFQGKKSDPRVQLKATTVR